MNLKWILIISCLILSTYAKSRSSGGSRRSSPIRRSSSSSNRGSSSSVGGHSSQVSRPSRQQSHTPHISSATHLPNLSKPRIPKPPPPPPPPPPPKNNFGKPASAPKPPPRKGNVQHSKGQLLKPVAEATSSRANVHPLSTAGLMGPGLIRMRKNNSTTNGNSSGNRSKSGNSFGSNVARNITAQANRSPFSTRTNTTKPLNIGKGNSFNKTSVHSFSKNVTKTGFQRGSAANVTAQTLAGVKITPLTKSNRTLTNSSGVIQVIPPKRNITQNSNGNAMPKALLLNGTRFNNTVNATGNARFNGTGSAQRGNVRFNATAVQRSPNNASAVQTGGVKLSSNNLNIQNINKNNDIPAQVPSTQTNRGLDNNQRTDSKSKKSSLKDIATKLLQKATKTNSDLDNSQGNDSKSKKNSVTDIAKKLLNKAAKKFGSKDKEVMKKTSHAVSTSLNGRGSNEYSWKSSVDHIPSKPPTAIMRNQIIIIAICITGLLLAAGIIVYFCNRK